MEIEELCGVANHLTYHMARQTFATTITLNNGVPMETVSKLLGTRPSGLPSTTPKRWTGK